MKLVIDAGSTKTASALVTRGSEHVDINYTSGINPVTDIHHEIKLHELLDVYKDKAVEEVYYYGSGCINTLVNNKLKSEIQSVFKQAQTSVHDDLLGACIATCGHDPGLTIIMGTGSNTGYYDGEKVIDGVTSGGYLLGDEGSGYRIGQEIYKRFSRGQLTPAAISDVESSYGILRSEAVQKLYEQSNPRFYLSSFANFINQLEDAIKNEILEDVFVEMIEKLIKPIQNKFTSQVHFVGSISFHFRQELKSILKKNDIIAGSFVKDPIAGLIKHHRYE